MALMRRPAVRRIAANPERKTTTLLTMPKTGMTMAHVGTLQARATNAFTAAETNISPAQTKPTITPTSDATALAIAGK